MTGYTTNELAEMTGLAAESICRLCRNGHLPGARKEPETLHGGYRPNVLIWIVPEDAWGSWVREHMPCRGIPDGIYTPAEAAVFCGVQESTARGWCARRRVPKRPDGTPGARQWNDRWVLWGDALRRMVVSSSPKGFPGERR